MTEKEDFYKFLADMTPNFLFKDLPPMPQFENLNDFLKHAKLTVRQKWTGYMMEAFYNLTDSRQRDKLKSIFHDEIGLISLLEKEKFRDLEMLRLVGEGKLWRDILTGISEREIATVLLAKAWLNSLDEKEIEKFHLNKHEIDIFLDLSLNLQIIVDQAYIHQLEIADAPGGKDLGPHAMVNGYEFLYKDNIPYIHVFTEEFTTLKIVLGNLVERISTEVEAGLLPSTYLRLSHFITTLENSYCSEEIDVKEILNTWKNVDQEYMDLVNSGSPILLTPWAFTADGGHVGIELIVTLNLAESSAWHRDSSDYLAVVSDYMKKYDPDFVPVPFVHHFVFVRNGINLPWSGTACAGDRSISFYDNENDNFSVNLYRSYYHSFVDGNTSEERFSYVRGLNTVAHETGHLGRMLDQDLFQKMGVGTATNKIDELKADAMANLFFLKKLEDSNDVTSAEFIEQYIIDYIDEMRGARGHEDEDTGMVWYDFSAKVILHLLFKNGAVGWKNDKVKVLDGKKGVDFLAQLGQQIFDLYGDPSFTAPAVKQFVQNMENDALENRDIQKFLLTVSRSDP